MDEIKAMLLQEKENIIADILKTQEHMPKDHDIGDEIDSSVEDQERKLMLLLQDREREKLEKIERALIRIENNDYGECEECGEPISPKRLMIVPFARLCINCKQEEERTSGVYSREDMEGSLRYMEE